MMGFSIGATRPISTDIVNRKEPFPSKESDTKILQSIHFAY